MSQKRIAIANQKGGVGKTTTSVNLAASLAAAGYKTLLIDLDPQGNASSGLGSDRHASATIYHVLIGEKSISDATQQTKLDNLYVSTANQDLIGAEVELINSISRERKLKTALKDIQGDFDFVVFDCPPSLGLLTINAFTASDSVIIPTQCEYYSLEGLGQLLSTFQLVKDELNEGLYIEGILLTMFDPRNKLTHEVVKELEGHFPQQLFQTKVPRNVKLSEAPSFGAPVLLYDKESKGCAAYLQLAEEVLVNNQYEKPSWETLFKEKNEEETKADAQAETLPQDVVAAAPAPAPTAEPEATPETVVEPEEGLPIEHEPPRAAETVAATEAEEQMTQPASDEPAAAESLDREVAEEVKEAEATEPQEVIIAEGRDQSTTEIESKPEEALETDAEEDEAVREEGDSSSEVYPTTQTAQPASTETEQQRDSLNS